MKQWKCLNKAGLQTSYININSIWMIDLKVKGKLRIFKVQIQKIMLEFKLLKYP